jgi:hypothetical protein
MKRSSLKTTNINAAIRLILPLIILTIIGFGCGESKTDEVKSGRLKYVETLRYGSVGSHGSQGWYVDNRQFYVNDNEFTPDGIKTEDIGDCKISPNPAVEVIKCYSYRNEQIRELDYLLRIKDNQPEWIAINDASDIWVGDGRWLLFKDFYFNVETLERKEIKGLPDHPKKYFMAASPDLETIIYEENCSMGLYNLETREKIPNKLLDERCEKHYEGGIYNGVAAYWLIDAKTGNVKILELKLDKYPSLIRPSPPGENRESNFKKMVVWEKDKNGKDQLVAPK